MATSKYSLEQNTAPAAYSKLLYISYSKDENDWYSLPHTHTFTELFYVTGGHGNLLIDGTEYPIREDDFIIVNSNVEHTERSLLDSPLEYIILGIEGLDFSFKQNKKHIIFSCKSKKQDFMYYMNAILKETTEKQPHYETICQHLLNVLIIKLIRQTDFSFEITPTLQINRECMRLKRYIEANYTRDITLDELASESHLNKYYLVHSFTKYCGCSPIQYLCQFRLQESRELLASTDYSIAQVAQISGFSSQSYFAQCFKKTYGITATAFRKTSKNRVERE